MTTHAKTPVSVAKLTAVFGLVAAALSASSAIQAQTTPPGPDGLPGQVAALQAQVNALQSQITALRNETANIRALNAYLSVNPPDAEYATARLSAINLQIVNGSPGGTGNESIGHANGLGNLIIGYNGRRTFQTPDDRTGSHYLVIGDGANYGNMASSSAGLLVGFVNTIRADYSSVSGGAVNTASSQYSNVSGGTGNSASGFASSVTGGGSNIASGNWSSVSGGHNNTASGTESSASGGFQNTASGSWGSVSGGQNNSASFSFTSVSGGTSNTASGVRSSVSGGINNTASGGCEWRAGTLTSGAGSC